MSGTIGSGADRARPALRAARMLVVATALSAAGCRDGRAAEADALPPPEERARMRLELTEVARSGPEVELGYVSSVDVGSRGEVYVADLMSSQILLLGPDLSLRRVIGRRGNGPEEFRSPQRVQVLAGDSVLTFDSESGRVAVWAPNMERVVRTFPVGNSQAFGAQDLFALPATSKLVAVRSHPFTVYDDPAAEKPMDVVLRLGSGGSVERDSLLTVPAREFIVDRGERGLMVLPDPFGRVSIVQPGPDGTIYHAWTDSLSVSIYDVDGSVRRRIRYDHVPPAATAADIDEFAEQGEELRSMRGLLEQTPHSTWPSIADMQVDDRGQVWIELSTPHGRPAEWIVVDADGSYVGSIGLERGSRLRHVSGSDLIAEQVRDSGETLLVRYRVSLPT